MTRAGALGAILLAAAMLGAGGAGAARSASSLIRPASSAGEIQVRVGAKSSAYSKASKTQPLAFRAKGPLSVRVLIRYLFPDSATAAGTGYHIRALIDGKPLRTEARRAAVSAGAGVGGAVRVGLLQRTSYQIPRGDHEIRLLPTEEGAVLLLRVLKGSGKRSSSKLVPFSPETYAAAVLLHAKDAESTVYRFTPEKPVGMTILGPLRLKVTTRIDFGGANGYTQAYVVKASLDGKPWKSFALKAKASHTATYPDLLEITPGMGKGFTLDVPSGRHEISIRLDGTTAGGASLAIRVPQKQTKGGD